MESSNPLFGANTMDKKKYSKMEAEITEKINGLFSKVVDDESKNRREVRTDFDPKIIEFAIRNELQNKSADEIYEAFVQSKLDAAQAEMDDFYGTAPQPEQEAGRVEKVAAAAAEGLKKFMGSLTGTGTAESKSKKRRKTRKKRTRRSRNYKSKKKRSKKRKRSSRKNKTKRRH